MNRSIRTINSLILGLGVLLGSATGASAEGKYLYILSNNVEFGENSVIAYVRGPGGSLTPHPMGPVSTRGTGINNSTNGKLGPNDNDTPLVVSAVGKRLFAVNGNSNTIAVFDIASDGSLSHVDGSPFDSMGVGPVSVAISGDTLIVANRNEDPHQLAQLRGSVHANYASFRIGADGALSFLSKIELADGQKPTQALVSQRDDRIVFGNDFQVDVDFDGDGDVSQLFGDSARVRGQLDAFTLDGGRLQKVNALTLPETVSPAPEVPTVPLGIWDHPTKSLLYVGLVTRNQLGVFRYDEGGALSFVAAVPNSGQDICWLRVNKAGTRLYAVNNLPREERMDSAGTVTVFDISGAKAEKPVEIQRIELPLPLGTFVNNRNAMQPNSAPFQLTLDDAEKFLYVINQRINQVAANTSPEGNVLHILSIGRDGKLTVVGSRHLGADGVHFTARPHGVVTVDL